MANHHRNSRGEAKTAPPGDAVARNMGGIYWTVDDCRWASIQPTLPADLSDLLAPPIIVGTVPMVAVAKPPSATMVRPPGPTPSVAKARNSGTARPAGRHRRPSPAA